MPFALLAVAIAPTFPGRCNRLLQWYRLRIDLNLSFFLFLPWRWAGWLFLNTWDFPIYVALVCGVYTLRSVLLPADL
jgi:hypothetical protein